MAAALFMPPSIRVVGSTRIVSLAADPREWPMQFAHAIAAELDYDVDGALDHTVNSYQNAFDGLPPCSPEQAADLRRLTVAACVLHQEEGDVSHYFVADELPTHGGETYGR